MLGKLLNKIGQVLKFEGRPMPPQFLRSDHRADHPVVPCPSILLFGSEHKGEFNRTLQP